MVYTYSCSNSIPTDATPDDFFWEPNPTKETLMFKSDLDVRLVNDLANEGRGEWELLSPLVYQSKDNNTYIVPAGFHCDYASVPRIPGAFWLTGDTAHRPAVLHDYLCRTKSVPRRLADDLFYEAMLSIGMPEWRASMMHIAVRSYSDSLEGDNNES